MRKNNFLKLEAILSIWQIIAIIAISLLVLEKTKPAIISPLTDNPVIPQVYAKEPPSLSNIITYIAQVFEKEGPRAIKQAINIAYCESHLNPNAYNFNFNQTGDYGLFQLNQIHSLKYSNKFFYDWKANIEIAHKIFRQQGWTPWVCQG